MSQSTAIRQVPSAPIDVERGLRSAGLTVSPIPRATVNTVDELRRVVAEERRPTLFSGLMDAWPARTGWTPRALADSHGDELVTALMNLPSTGVLFPREQRHYERTLPFREFLHHMVTTPASSPCYLAYTRAAALFSPRDHDFTGLLGADEGSDTRVWIGSAGTRSMLHSDLKDNVFGQVWGEKHVVLLPWEASRAAYPFPDNLVNSQVDLAEPDLARFPRLRDAVLLAGRVGPGDLLFMPRGTWHDIRSLTPSISINHWFGPPLRTAEYLRLLARLGPVYWGHAGRDLVRHGLLRRPERSYFFFSPPSTGKRLYSLLRWGDFSRDNDPARD
jgi:hypothetical protein